MEIVFENKGLGLPKVSIILLDWSCRESFHVLDYLAKQTVPRDQYEVIWIEYYNRRAPQIDQKLEECAAAGRPPIVDWWVVMGTSKNVYYHKHLMYNIGIVLSRGDIVVICDSDAIVKDGFVETIVQSFEEEPNLVLHLDEVRNNDRRFYPFNYPRIEEVTGEGCINWEKGKTTGLWDTEDILHTRNYGACLCAVRADLISIGGADEHIDYLGHICGPYDMTFRLVNFGKKEFWHPEEFLYHVWHPGQAGDNNYLGPHDGKHMSTTALEARRTGRTLPLVENPAIKIMRLGGTSLSSALVFPVVVSDHTQKGWSVETLGGKKSANLTPDGMRPDLPAVSSFGWKEFRSWRTLVAKLFLCGTFLKLLTKQFYLKLAKVPRQVKTVRVALAKVVNAFYFLRNVWLYNLYTIRQARKCLRELIGQNIKEISIYGRGDIAEILYDLTFELPLNIQAIYDDFGGGKFFKVDVFPVEACASGNEKVVIAAMIGIDEKVVRLRRLGVSRERIIVLQ